MIDIVVFLGSALMALSYSAIAPAKLPAPLKPSAVTMKLKPVPSCAYTEDKLVIPKTRAAENNRRIIIYNFCV